ncbi:MAG: IMP dehydrogenase [Nanoarchaeota archaeon]|nr:IMP dehydrogenase [Nanoarchaeota archaeon]
MARLQFFENLKNIGVAVTYDDVRLKSGHSKVEPASVILESKFSRNIPLKIPIVSAAMDTVTEHKLAIGMAKLGGLGIIHKNLSAEEQAKEVAKVKFHLHGLIDKPICVYEDETIENIQKRIDEKGWKFHSFPVINRSGKLAGILTKNDFDFCDDDSQEAKDVMTEQVLTKEPDTPLEDAYDFMKKNKKKILPLVNDDLEVVGLYVFSDLARIIKGKSSMHNVDKKGRLLVGAAIGVGVPNILRAEMLIKKQVDVLVIDTAHGDSKAVLDTLMQIKKRFKIDVVAGNISEPDSALRLVEAGADGIKVGQGAGSICTTRIIAGIGCPQVSAIYNCASGIGVPVCADGGLRNSGDIPIAIGAGAHSVMMGGMLSGTEESPGEMIFLEGRQWKRYRGMGSLGAMRAHKESRARYRVTSKKMVPEGVEGMVPYKGRLADVIFQYLGGLRSGMGYVGAANIEELREKADFHRITHAGFVESHPHDIHITEASNYTPRE